VWYLIFKYDGQIVVYVKLIGEKDIYKRLYTGYIKMFCRKSQITTKYLSNKLMTVYRGCLIINLSEKVHAVSNRYSDYADYGLKQLEFCYLAA
jgi:molybdopterin biosynthesis enzyme MoaB